MWREHAVTIFIRHNSILLEYALATQQQKPQKASKALWASAKKPMWHHIPYQCWVATPDKLLAYLKYQRELWCAVQDNEQKQNEIRILTLKENRRRSLTVRQKPLQWNMKKYITDCVQYFAAGGLIEAVLPVERGGWESLVWQVFFFAWQVAIKIRVKPVLSREGDARIILHSFMHKPPHFHYLPHLNCSCFSVEVGAPMLGQLWPRLGTAADGIDRSGGGGSGASVEWCRWLKWQGIAAKLT